MRCTNHLPTFLTGAVALALALAAFATPVPAAGPAGPTVDPAPSTGVVAYYFHGDFRCSTCRKLEALSRQAITSGFGKELESRHLEFRVVNVETPGTQHFVKDFQLVTKSLVLVEYRDGKVLRWKNLPKIWELVRDQDAFIHYVQEQTRAFLGES